MSLGQNCCTFPEGLSLNYSKVFRIVRSLRSRTHRQYNSRELHLLDQSSLPITITSIFRRPLHSVKMSKHLLVVLILATTAFATQLAHRSQPVRRQFECSGFDKVCGDGCIWFAWDCCVDGTYCGPYLVCSLYGGCDLISIPPGASSLLTTTSSIPANPATSILLSQSLAQTTQGSSTAVSDPTSSYTHQGSASAPTSVSGVSSGSALVKPLSPISAGTAHLSSLTQAASSSSTSNSQLASSSTSGTATAPTSTLVQASGALGAAVNKNAIALGLMMVARHLFL